AGMSFHMQDDGHSMIFKPYEPLAYSAACTLVVHSPLRDLQGQALPAAVRSLSPPGAPAGSPITINGDGFSNIPSGNTVSFNGVVAPVTSASAVSLVTTVPASATSGPLTVSVGAATSAPVTFNVFPPNPTPL